LKPEFLRYFYMIKIHRIPLSLCISAASLVLFAAFSTFVNHYSKSYEHQVREVRRSQNFASDRLEMLREKNQRQTRISDSLKTIIKARKDPRILWTARAIYSETRNPREMRYVGWVIRNRQEANFRGRSYRSVILHPKQFSAFNRGYPLREFYLSLQPEQTAQRARWFSALRAAESVIESPRSYSPIPKDTFHFYSEISMKGRKHPHWRSELSKVEVAEIEERRFRFFQQNPKLASNGK